MISLVAFRISFDFSQVLSRIVVNSNIFIFLEFEKLREKIYFSFHFQKFRAIKAHRIVTLKDINYVPFLPEID